MGYYRTYSSYLKEKYGEKVYKLPIALPVTCPNRTGLCGTGGCTFCGEIGAGYENLPASITVKEQIEKNIAHIAPKYKANLFIPYFQNFTNTFLPVDAFAAYVEEAVSQPQVVGLAIATRPDCIHPMYLDVLQEAFRKYEVDVTIELGLQSINPNSLALINRGHGLGEYIDAVLQIAPYGFDVCTHIIGNLPWDSRLDVVEAAKVISALPVQQAKIHALYIIKNTLMARQYQSGEFTLCTLPEYVDRVVSFVEHLRPDIVLQRLVGRAPKESTLFANWGRGWWVIRDMIEAEFERRGTRQGSHCNYLHGAAVREFVGGAGDGKQT